MVGPAGDTGAAGTLPVVLEHRVQQIAAFGGFDEGEVHAGDAGLAPVQRLLEARHIDAVHRIAVGALAGPVERLAVAEIGRRHIPHRDRELRRTTGRKDKGREEGKDAQSGHRVTAFVR